MNPPDVGQKLKVETAGAEPAAVTHSELSEERLVAAGEKLNNLPETVQTPSLVGKVLGHYEVLACLGKGGTSSVYKARDILLDRTVSIKILSECASDERALRRLKSEAMAASRLRNSHIITVFEFQTPSDGPPYLVMDFVEGKTLAEVLADEERLPLPRVVDIITQACEALIHAHANGVIHRDLKPSNIMLCKDEHGRDNVKLVDFGIAKVMLTSDTSVHVTNTGEIFGSPLYMSPEQCMGRRLDIRSDLYSLGCVMYEMLAGTPPFAGQTMLEIMYKQMHEAAVPVNAPELDISVLRKIDFVLRTALAKDPDYRYRTIKEFKDDVEKLLRLPGLRKVPKFAKIARRAIARLALVLAITLPVASIASAELCLYDSSQPSSDYCAEKLWDGQPPNTSDAADSIFKEGDLKNAFKAAAENEFSERFAAAARQLAGFYLEEHKYAEAREHFQQALEVTKELGTQDPIAELGLAQTLGEMGYFKEALAHAGDAIEIFEQRQGPMAEHRLADARLLYCNILLHSEDYTGAQVELRSLINDLSNRDESYQDRLFTAQCRLAESYRRQGNGAQAERDYNALLDNSTNDESTAAIFYALALTNKQMGNPDTADIYFSRALDQLERLDSAQALRAMIMRDYAKLLTWRDPLRSLYFKFTAAQTFGSHPTRMVRPSSL